MSEENPEDRRRRLRATGSLGGRIGGAARAAALSSDRRSEIARIAAMARWGGAVANGNITASVGV
jgi:hypothetical protein